LVIVIIKKGKSESKAVPLPSCRHQGGGVQLLLILDLGLDGVSCQRHAPAALYPRERTPRYPLDRRLSGHQSWSEHRCYRKNFVSAGYRTPVVQSVVTHYTDWATLAHDNDDNNNSNDNDCWVGDKRKVKMDLWIP
jgi:hypothetical protein